MFARLGILKSDYCHEMWLRVLTQNKSIIELNCLPNRRNKIMHH